MWKENVKNFLNFELTNIHNKDILKQKFEKLSDGLWNDKIIEQFLKLVDT